MQFSKTNKQTKVIVHIYNRSLFFVSHSWATAVTLGKMARNTQLKTNNTSIQTTIATHSFFSKLNCSQMWGRNSFFTFLKLIILRAFTCLFFLFLSVRHPVGYFVFWDLMHCLLWQKLQVRVVVNVSLSEVEIQLLEDGQWMCLHTQNVLWCYWADLSIYCRNWQL